VGLSSGAISNAVYVLVLNTAIVTMALTPVLSGLVPPLYERFWPRRQREQFEAANLPASGLSDHIVIAGAGRVGRGIAEALRHMDLPFVLIESVDRHVRQARQAGLPVIFGDASQAVVLEAARLSRARALLVTVPAFPDVRGIVAGARRVKPDIPVIARAESSDAVRELYSLGIQEVTSPEFEAAIEMTRQALMYCHEVARTIRHEQYGLSEAHSDSAMKLMSDIGEIGRQLEFTWVGLPAGSGMDGRTLESLRVRTTTGASVVGIIRHGALQANPDGAAALMAGDLIAILGTREQIERFQAAARTAAQPG
jgi:CPA2 family monovalent cation:H+ antiporter-2